MAITTPLPKNFRPATPRMTSFLKDLLGTREHDLPMTPSDADGLSFARTSELIDCLKGLPRRGTPLTPRMAAYLRGLLEEREHDVRLTPEEVDGLSFARGRKLIDHLVGLPRKSKPLRDGVVSNFPDEGIYFVDGTYYKVQANVAMGSGTSRYAKRFDGETAKWVYVGKKPFPLLISDKRIASEQAAAFGDLYGRCVKCHRVLTDEYSIAHGYGRICGDQMGF